MNQALLLSIFLTLLVSAAPAKDLEIAGNYAAEGDAGNGGIYKATVVISPLGTEGAYLVEWKTKDGDYSGTAVRDGDRLAVAIRLHDGDGFHPDYAGIIIYRISAGPTLEGKWTANSLEGKVFREFLTYKGK